MSRNIFEANEKPEEEPVLTEIEKLELEIEGLEHELWLKKDRWLALKRRGSSGQTG